MYNQVPHSRAVLPYAAVARAGVVHLIRRNLLDVVISYKLATVNGIYHRPDDGRPPIPWQPPAPTQRQIELDPSELLPELQRLRDERQRFRGWLRLSSTRSCEVDYEMLSADLSNFGRILAFLGLPARDAALLTSGLKQIRSSSQSQMITNFAEVERSLAGTHSKPTCRIKPRRGSIGLCTQEIVAQALIALEPTTDARRERKAASYPAQANERSGFGL